LKYSSLQHNLKIINILLSHSKEKLNYLTPKLITCQITLGNKYELEVTRRNGSGSKPLMKGYNKQLDKK
jgi:hypothetical protein